MKLEGVIKKRRQKRTIYIEGVRGRERECVYVCMYGEEREKKGNFGSI